MKCAAMFVARYIKFFCVAFLVRVLSVQELYNDLLLWFQLGFIILGTFVSEAITALDGRPLKLGTFDIFVHDFSSLSA